MPPEELQQLETLVQGTDAVVATIIQGKKIAEELRKGGPRGSRFYKGHGLLPALAVVLVGENAASKIYVRRKVSKC